MRCPLRTLEGLLDKDADADADDDVGCRVSMGLGWAFGADNKLAGFSDTTSVMTDMPSYLLRSKFGA